MCILKIDQIILFFSHVTIVSEFWIFYANVQYLENSTNRRRHTIAVNEIIQ